MSLNGYLALGFGCAVLLSPVLLPLSLLVIVPAWRRELRRARAEGIVVLPAFLVDTVVAAAEAMIADQPPPGSWRQVGLGVDRYLAAIDSPRRWRIVAVLVLLEFAPWLTLQRRLSKLAPAARANFVRRRLARTRGPFAIPGMARQLVRLAYYNDPAVGARIGFTGRKPPSIRRRAPAGDLLAG